MTRVLLTTRQHFCVQLTGHKNALHAVNRKKVSSVLAKQAHQTLIEQIAKQIKAIDQEIRRLIDSDPTFKQTLLLLLSVPGIGLPLAAHLLIHMQTTLDPKTLAAFIGICPIQHESGSSVFSTPTSRHYGPPVLRKLLYLAACSVRTHQKQFQRYFFRKVAEGKHKKLVLNNIRTKFSRSLVLSSALNNLTYQTMSLSIPWGFSKKLDSLIVFEMTRYQGGCILNPRWIINPIFQG
ncbi:MAG TPA: transposase [Anaerolineales bacterium]|nr:transposase [Anaerolineales bacterium]